MAYMCTTSKPSGETLRKLLGYLKWRSTLSESEDSSKYTVGFAIQWHKTAIRPSITQELATAI